MTAKGSLRSRMSLSKNTKAPKCCEYTLFSLFAILYSLHSNWYSFFAFPLIDLRPSGITDIPESDRRISQYSNIGFPWLNYWRYRFDLADSNVATIYIYLNPTSLYLILTIEAGIKRRVWISAKPEAIAYLPDAESPCSSPWWMLGCLIGRIKNVSEPSLRFRDILTHPLSALTSIPWRIKA